jgi:hypothetical protein
MRYYYVIYVCLQTKHVIHKLGLADIYMFHTSPYILHKIYTSFVTILKNQDLFIENVKTWLRFQFTIKK